MIGLTWVVDRLQKLDAVEAAVEAAAAAAEVVVAGAVVAVAVAAAAAVDAFLGLDVLAQAEDL